MPRPRKGDEIRETISLRIEPKTKQKLLKRFGSVQRFFDSCIASILDKNKKESTK